MTEPRIGEGTVGPIPEGGPARPKGYLWDRLDAANTVEELTELRDHAKAHGYSPEGQLMTAIADKFATFAGEKK